MAASNVSALGHSTPRLQALMAEKLAAFGLGTAQPLATNYLSCLPPPILLAGSDRFF